VIDEHGVEWLTVYDAAAAMGIQRGTIYAWLARGIIRTHRAGRRVAVNMPDVYEAEYAWRQRAKGHQRHAGGALPNVGSGE
jgi:excisionase family DNA binding protein